MNYKGCNNGPRKHQRCTNMMDAAPQLSLAGMVYVTVHKKNEKKISWIVRRKQKSIFWIKDGVDKFSNPGELVVDIFSVHLRLQWRAQQFNGTVVL